MDITKRNLLIQKLSEQPEPHLVEIHEFFNGNDDMGSIGCNLVDYPGIDAFRAVFFRISERDDVEAIYAQIAELAPGDDCWPFTDTIFVVGTLTVDVLVSELAILAPDEVGSAEEFRIPDFMATRFSAPILAAWWD